MAKPKLCEIIAVVSGKKGEVEKSVTQAYHVMQKADLFGGLSRTYSPRTEDGEQLPSESKHPQMKAKDVIMEACGKWSELFNLTLTLDVGNCMAKGDIVIDERLIAPAVPVSTLLFLEKQLANIHAFISKLPTPDPAETWTYNKDQDMLTTQVKKTARTKKVQKPLVLFPATPEHPAQTQLITEDVVAGDWSQVSFTTAIPAKEKNDMLDRVAKLQDAVKVARERANGVEVENKKLGEPILGYIFEKLAKK